MESFHDLEKQQAMIAFCSTLILIIKNASIVFQLTSL